MPHGRGRLAVEMERSRMGQLCEKKKGRKGTADRENMYNEFSVSGAGFFMNTTSLQRQNMW